MIGGLKGAAFFMTPFNCGLSGRAVRAGRSGLGLLQFRGTLCPLRSVFDRPVAVQTGVSPATVAVFLRILFFGIGSWRVFLCQRNINPLDYLYLDRF